MSTVRYLDQVPHIVRYGMHNESTEKFWMIFWRNGVKFKIEIEGADVVGTPFYKTWRPLMTENFDSKAGTRRNSLGMTFVEQWEALCDVVLPAAMPLLRELAPVKTYWTKLSEYLHGPYYRLKLARNTSGDQVVPETIEGPKDWPAYELLPAAREELGQISDTLAVYYSTDLEVLDQEKDWRQAPGNVRSTGDGRIFQFQPCERGVGYPGTAEFVNHSINAINAMLDVHLHLKQNIVPIDLNIRNVEVVVKDLDPETKVEKIAGLLLTYTPHTRSLHNTLSDDAAQDTSDIPARAKVWEEQIRSTLRALHAVGIFYGGRTEPWWPYLNEHSVSIDDKDRVWMSMKMQRMSEDKKIAEKEEAMDERAVKRLFGEWVVEKTRGERSQHGT